MTDLSLQTLSPWLLDVSAAVLQSGLRILLVLAGGLIGARFIDLGVHRLEAIMIRAGEAAELIPGSTRKRVATLIGLLHTMALALLWAIVVVIALDQVGLDITPILAGAGIIGLAVGFGAQNLVRDLISGFFIVLENQIRVGDVAIINGTGGLVESITFRTTTLRDFSGVVHVFPNGTIATLSNMTKGWSAFVLDMGVAYKEDTDRVAEVMRQVGEELRHDPIFGPKFLEPIELVGVEDFADSAVVIRVRIKTVPIEQWNIGREYRRRLKKAFDAAGIEIPFPHRSLYMGEAGKPFTVQVLSEPKPASS